MSVDTGKLIQLFERSMIGAKKWDHRVEWVAYSMRQAFEVFFVTDDGSQMAPCHVMCICVSGYIKYAYVLCFHYNGIFGVRNEKALLSLG